MYFCRHQSQDSPTSQSTVEVNREEFRYDLREMIRDELYREIRTQLGSPRTPIYQAPPPTDDE